MQPFPALRWPKLWRILQREPLLYEVERQAGSHMKLVSRAGYPVLRLAFHANAEIPPGLVQKILMGDVGLSEEQARSLL